MSTDKTDRDLQFFLSRALDLDLNFLSLGIYFLSLNLDLIFLTFLMFDSIWIQSHMQAMSHQSEILHSLRFVFTWAVFCFVNM